MPKTDTYIYFISYTDKDGSGNTMVERNSKVVNFEDVKNIQNELRFIDGLSSLVIINFILLDSYNAEERKQQEKEPGPSIGYPH